MSASAAVLEAALELQTKVNGLMLAALYTKDAKIIETMSRYAETTTHLIRAYVQYAWGPMPHINAGKTSTPQAVKDSLNRFLERCEANGDDVRKGIAEAILRTVVEMVMEMARFNLERGDDESV